MKVYVRGRYRGFLFTEFSMPGMAESSQDSSKKGGSSSGQGDGGRGLPADFASRIATKIIVTQERERDPEAAALKVSSLITRNLNVEGRHSQFLEATRIMLEDEDTQRYAAVSWASLHLAKDQNPAGETFLGFVLDAAIIEHMNLEKPLYEMEMRRKKFSHYAWMMGEVFINITRMSNELFDVVSHMFSLIIRKEMIMEQKMKEERSTTRRLIVGSQKEKETASKKLFDDLVDYIHTRGEFKSDSLNQQNPNEFIAVLADRLRGTRRYVIQDIVNKQAMDRKKQAEKELSEKQASAEEIIRAKDPFKKALRLFWTEKRYNFKYLSVEKVRVTLQMIAVVVGIGHFLIGYIGLLDIHWGEGIVVGMGMYLFARFAISRKSFLRFYPEDVSKELETVVGHITPTLRKMTKTQLSPFLVNQVKDGENTKLLLVVPEFVKYLFAVMPERRNMIVTYEQLHEIMETLEMEVSRQARDLSYFHRPPPA